jgi:hypothetical protein
MFEVTTGYAGRLNSSPARGVRDSRRPLRRIRVRAGATARRIRPRQGGGRSGRCAARCVTRLGSWPWRMRACGGATGGNAVARYQKTGHRTGQKPALPPTPRPANVRSNPPGSPDKDRVKTSQPRKGYAMTRTYQAVKVAIRVIPVNRLGKGRAVHTRRHAGHRPTPRRAS